MEQHIKIYQEVSGYQTLSLFRVLWLHSSGSFSSFPFGCCSPDPTKNTISIVSPHISLYRYLREEWENMHQLYQKCSGFNSSTYILHLVSCACFSSNGILQNVQFFNKNHLTQYIIIFLSHLYGLLSFRLKYQHFRSIKCQATTYHLQLYWSKQKAKITFKEHWPGQLQHIFREALPHQ